MPLVFNCTAGKDRTGVAAALVLGALGVPRKTIDADYALSNLAVEGLVTMSAGHTQHSQAGAPMDEGYAPLLRPKTDYQDSAFKAFDRRSGGMDGYLEFALGLSASDIERLRDALLE